jgi:hypothetical protein
LKRVASFSYGFLELGVTIHFIKMNFPQRNVISKIGYLPFCSL